MGRCFARYNDPKHILVFGDSNSARSYPGRRESWPRLLEKMSKGSLDVINESIDGRTTGFDSLQLNGKQYFRRILDRYPEIDALIIMLGTNDFKSEYGPARPEEVASNIVEMIEFCQSRKRGLKYVLLTPPPVNGGKNLGENADRHLEELADLLCRLEMRADIAVVDLHAKLKPCKHLAGDGVHLNAKGRRYVASLVYNRLCSILNS